MLYPFLNMSPKHDPIYSKGVGLGLIEVIPARNSSKEKYRVVGPKNGPMAKLKLVNYKLVGFRLIPFQQEGSLGLILKWGHAI